MKYIAKHFILLLFFSFALGSYAQSRSPKTTSTIKVVSKSEKLRQATGWKQDITGEWISNENAISDIKLSQHEFGTVLQNFKWLQFVELRSANKTYYGILYENEVYVSTSLNEKRINFYMMDVSSYTSLLNNIRNKNGETLTIHSPIYGYLPERDGAFLQEDLLLLIKQKISSQGQVQFDVVVNCQHVDDADVVRFRLPERTSIMSSSLEQGYFEIPVEVFSKLLPSPLPVTSVKVDSDTEFELDAESRPTATSILQEETERGERDSGGLVLTKSMSENADVYKAKTPEDMNDNLGERQNKEAAQVSSPIAKMANIKGWYCNAEGKWVSDDDYSYNFETVGHYEFRNMSYKSKDYLIFIKYEKYAGALYFVLPKEEYIAAVKSMNNSGTVQFPVIAHVGIGYTIDDLVKSAQSVIDAPKKEEIVKKEYNLVMQYRTSQSKNIARFFIYAQSCTQYGESGNKSCDTKTSNKIKYYDVPFVGTERLFDKMYYETSFDNFRTFIEFPLNDNNQIEAPVVKEKVSDGLESRD